MSSRCVYLLLKRNLCCLYGQRGLYAWGSVSYQREGSRCSFYNIGQCEKASKGGTRTVDSHAFFCAVPFTIYFVLDFENRFIKAVAPDTYQGKIMKTKLWNVLFVQLMLVLSVVSFNSCSDDDDDDTSFAPTIVGTWDCEDIEGYSLQFNSNHTGVETLTVNSTMTQGGFEYQYNDQTGRVSIVGCDGNMFLEDGTYSVTIGTTTMNLGGVRFKRR